MVDFVKVEVPPTVGRRWLVNSALDFYTPVNLKTGECTAYQEAEYKHLLFKIYPSGRATVEGSLHKLRHGQHNGGNFPAWALADTIAELAYSFEFQPEQAILHGIEFGVNVSLPVSATSLLSRAVLYKTLPFSVQHFGDKGYYLEAKAQQYSLKLYDKQRHLMDKYRLRIEPLLRLELRVRRMTWLSEADVVTLADLTCPTKLAALGGVLAEAWQQVLVAAVAIPAGLSKAERHLLREGRHPNYWQTLNEQHPASLRKNRQRYRELTARHAPDVLSLAAAEGLVSQWKHLRTATPDLPDLTGWAEKPIPELTDFPAVAARPVYPGFNHLSIGVETGIVGGVAEQPVVRRCQTCGRDISSQSARSIFCSEGVYGKAAKRCRNAASNPRNNTRRTLQRATQQAYLFDMVPHLRLPATVREFVLSGLSWQVQRAQ